jgi:ferredoxin-thioredoxin reductase catalytic chain
VSDPRQTPAVTREEGELLFRKLDREAESSGYHLNPNREFTLGLIEGLLVNERRYGYWACPCRLASGNKAEDLDIICPCDYRDSDLVQYGTCYCALYVSQEVMAGVHPAARIPDRRPVEGMREASASGAASANAAAATGRAPAPVLPDLSRLSYPLWRCKVCGYLCAREEPPEACPICKAKKERFERFL